MLEKLSSPLYQSFGLTAFEENVLKWCDLMELVLWCLEDIRLGNLYAAGPCGRGLAWLHASDEVTTRSNCCPTALPLLKEVTATALRMGVTLKE